jgi:hypothetical protein
LKLILWRVKNRRIETSVVFTPNSSRIRRPISAKVRVCLLKTLEC